MRVVCIVGRLTSMIGAAAFIACPSHIAIASETYFSFISTPGSWVGHGYLNYLVTPEMGWSFSASGRADRGFVSLSARSLDPNAPTGNYYWDLRLEAPSGQILSPGLYENATRYPFNDDGAGLTLSGNHRGNNRNTGYFTVREADFGPDGVVNAFSVDFRQHDEGSPSHWVDGHFRFNATVPEPASLGLLAMAGLIALRVRRARSR